MYSYEIQNWLESKNYTLTSQEYIKLITDENNIQIDHIKFDPFANKTNIWTNDGYEWSISVVK